MSSFSSCNASALRTDSAALRVSRGAIAPFPFLACLACLLLVFALGGCAAVAYREGKDLVAQDRVEEGLAKFREAMESDPRDAEYREAFLQTRERSIFAYLAQADRLAADKKRPEAEKLYQRVLTIDPGNERASIGLRNLDRAERHDKWIKEADAALAKKDLVTANQRLSAILTENPHHPQVRALQERIVEQSPKPATEATLADAYRKKISMDFKDAPLKQIFEVLSRSTGLNFIFDKDVKTDQKTSIFLKNNTIESIIRYALMTNQLQQQILDSNTLMIYPNTAAKKKDYQEMVVRTFFLANAEAKSVANTLKTILKSQDIVVDDKLNMLIVRDTPYAIRLAEKLIALQDVAEPEVMLEVEVLEVTRTRLMELGIQWPGSLALTPLAQGSTAASTTSTTSSTGTLTLYDLIHRNNKTIGAGVSSTNINASLTDSDVNLLANPRIRARNREKAKILIGQRVPNITTTATSTGFVSESINYLDVGLSLNVEPTIFLDDDVAIKISLEVSNIVGQIKSQSGSTAYQIGTRTATTVLSLKDGETQVLAGLINNEERTSGNKVPGLGEIPILGRLFGSTTDNAQKTEIVLSITPHLVRNIHRPDLALAEFKAGTDSDLGGGSGTASGGSSAVTASATTAPKSPTAPTTIPSTSPSTHQPTPGTSSSTTSGTTGLSGSNNPFGSGSKLSPDLFKNFLGGARPGASQ